MPAVGQAVVPRLQPCPVQLEAVCTPEPVLPVLPATVVGRARAAREQTAHARKPERRNEQSHVETETFVVLILVGKRSLPPATKRLTLMFHDG